VTPDGSGDNALVLVPPNVRRRRLHALTRRFWLADVQHRSPATCFSGAEKAARRWRDSATPATSLRGTPHASAPPPPPAYTTCCTTAFRCDATPHTASTAFSPRGPCRQTALAPACTTGLQIPRAHLPFHFCAPHLLPTIHLAHRSTAAGPVGGRLLPADLLTPTSYGLP